MCVSVWVTPGTLLTPPGMTSASSSCALTRTIATRSNSPVTEYTSLIWGICASSAAISGMRWTSAFTRTIAVTTGRLLRSSSGLERSSAGYLGERPHAGRGKPPDEAVQHRDSGPRVGEGAMAWRRRRAEIGRQRGQLAVGHLGLAEHLPRQRDRVEHREVRPWQAAVAARRDQEAEIEGRVVRGEHAAAGEREEAGQHCLNARGVRYHRVADPGQGRDLGRDRVPRVDQRAELPGDLPAGEPDRADLRDSRLAGRPPGVLQPNDDEVGSGGRAPAAGQQR